MKLKRVLGVLVVQGLLLSANELESLFTKLNEISDETKLSSSYNPTSLYVLYGHELASLGIKSLDEALDFVPGIETIVGTSITRRVVVRGNAQPLNPAQEKLQFFINGVELGSNYLPSFPVNLIERIEIMKGSYFSGTSNKGLIATINIVTKEGRDHDNELNIGLGSFEERSASAILNHKVGAWDVGIDAYYLKNSKTVDAPSGQFAPQLFPIENSRAKESLEGVDTQGIGLIAKNSHWSIKARHDESTQQNHYGFFGYLDFNEESYNRFEISTLQASYQRDIDSKNSFGLSGGVLENRYKMNTYLYPLEPNPFGFYNPHSRVAYTEQNLFGQLKMSNRYFENHTLEYGINIMQNKMTQNDFYTNLSPSANVGLFVPQFNTYVPVTDQLTHLTGSEGFFNNPKKSRDKVYYLKDYLHLNEHLDASVEVRYDDNDHYKDRINYKVGTVYTHDDAHIYKMIFSKQYRTPSTIEARTVGYWNVYGSQDLESESVENLEFIYLYKQPSETFSLDAYYAQYRDVIDYRVDGDTFVYYNNSEKQKNYGIELEYTKRFANKSTLLFNASYAEYRYLNRQVYQETINTPLASKLTSNVGYIYPLSFRTNIGTLLKYYGDKRMLNNDKEDIGSTYLVDMTLNHSVSDALQVHLGVKNLFDQAYYYYGYNTTDNQMLREGRTWLFNMKYAF